MNDISPAAKAARDAARQADGKFGNQHHSEPEAWGEPGGDDEGPVRLRLGYEYVQHGLPSRRHRKPQWYSTPETLELELVAVTGDEAPVAAAATNPDGDAVELRFRDGRWLRSTGRDPQEWLENATYGRSDSENGPSMYDSDIERIQAAADEAVVIDGVVWEPTPGEPGYRVATFGLGGNHGGTALFAELIAPDEHGLVASSGFGIDEYDLAVAKAREIAEQRGDTDSIDRIGVPEQQRWQIGPATTDAIAARAWRRPIELPDIPFETRRSLRSGETTTPAVREQAQQVLAGIHEHCAAAGILERATEPGQLDRVDTSRLAKPDRDDYRNLLLRAYG